MSLELGLLRVTVAVTGPASSTTEAGLVMLLMVRSKVAVGSPSLSVTLTVAVVFIAARVALVGVPRLTITVSTSSEILSSTKSWSIHQVQIVNENG